MLISRTSQYAIQALICLGLREEGVMTNVRDFAQWLGVPAAYLSKILQILSQHGLLVSSRGRFGGFSLRVAAEKVNLLHVLAITERGRFSVECLLGLKICGDDTACPMHGRWKLIKANILDMLETQTLATLATAVGKGQYRLANLPDSLIAPLLQSEQ